MKADRVYLRLDLIPKVIQLQSYLDIEFSSFAVNVTPTRIA